MAESFADTGSGVEPLTVAVLQVLPTAAADTATGIVMVSVSPDG
jgi:hypothetical protein